MKRVLIGITLVIASLSAQQTFASASQGVLNLCPQDGRNDVNAFHTSTLTIGSAYVDVAVGGSEPNFSSEIQWNANGVVTLVRKNKASIIIGQGERPQRSSPCGAFPFTLSDAIQIEAHSKKGPAFQFCNTETGCNVVHPSNDVIVIKTESETIVYTGNNG